MERVQVFHLVENFLKQDKYRHKISALIDKHLIWLWERAKSRHHE